MIVNYKKVIGESYIKRIKQNLLMEFIKKTGYLLLFGIVLYLLSIYVIKIFGWILNVLLVVGLVAAAYWLYKKIESED